MLLSRLSKSQTPAFPVLPSFFILLEIILPLSLVSLTILEIIILRLLAPGLIIPTIFGPVIP